MLQAYPIADTASTAMKPSEMAYLLALLVERPPEPFDPVEVFRLRWVGSGFQMQLNGSLFLVVYHEEKAEPERLDVFAISTDMPYRTETSALLQAHLTTLLRAVQFVRENAAGEHLAVHERAIFT